MSIKRRTGPCAPMVYIALIHDGGVRFGSGAGGRQTMDL